MYSDLQPDGGASDEPTTLQDRPPGVLDLDNGSAHHPATFPDHLSSLHEHAIAVHLPTHASWLNQIELYFSILQHKALTPRDFSTPDEMADRILAFQDRFSVQAKPFNWRFSADDLRQRMQLLN